MKVGSISAVEQAVVRWLANLRTFERVVSASKEFFERRKNAHS